MHNTASMIDAITQKQQVNCSLSSWILSSGWLKFLREIQLQGRSWSFSIWLAPQNIDFGHLDNIGDQMEQLLGSNRMEWYRTHWPTLGLLFLVQILVIMVGINRIYTVYNQKEPVNFLL